MYVLPFEMLKKKEEIKKIMLINTDFDLRVLIIKNTGMIWCSQEIKIIQICFCLF